jgi:mxaL protein
MNNALTKRIKDYRLWCLTIALTLMLVTFLHPKDNQDIPVQRLIVIVDITRSMNAEDYSVDDKALSRLAYVKQALRELLLKLPCQSTLGLGLFTDRRSTLLFEPIEVCNGFNELDSAIAALDWRMAWAADSRIASGLLSTLDMLKGRKETVLFMTDGQEAPPVNPKYRANFIEVKNKLHGLLVGVGGLQAVPIPKYNYKGERQGNYQPEDVPHRSSFGSSDLNPDKIEGYDARNAPFGSADVIGNEHLSTLNESYLKQLGDESGFAYHRLIDTNSLFTVLQNSSYQVKITSEVDVRWQWVTVVIALLIILWL